VLVSGLTEADITSQIPPGRADDPIRRQTALNVPLIRPMKKLVTIFCVLAAISSGVYAQSNILNATGSSTFSGLTVATRSTDGFLDYTRARLGFSFSNLPVGVSISFSGLSLIGPGISTSLSFPDFVLSTTSLVDTPYVLLDTPVEIFNSSSSRVAFNTQVNNGSLPFGGVLTYRLQYNDSNDTELTTRTGDITITAVPEPSAYAAAAGLLALFLWSSRRHLFKLAGARSSASGPGENGAS